jgi:sporulation protein YqfC
VSGQPFTQRALQWLDLPPDALLALPRMETVGRLQLRVTNHRGIQHYDQKRVVVRLADGALEVSGDAFVIDWITADEVVVTGRIDGLRFVEADRRTPGAGGHR